MAAPSHTRKKRSALRLLVAGEAAGLLASMRRSGRWAGNKMDGYRDPLVAGLARLQQDMATRPTGGDESICQLLQPFCEVVSSEETSGPLTGMAITSINKLLCADLISPSMPSAADGIKMVAEAITHARFVGTSSSSDEVVLMKILKVLCSILSVGAGSLLSDEGVCEIMQSCFRICFEERLSELLRCYAEGVLMEMVQILFSNLVNLSEEEADQYHYKAAGAIVMAPPTTSTEDTSYEDDTAIEREEESAPPPHGLVCVREVLRFLVSIIDLRDSGNTNRLMATGLGLVHVALETGCQYMSESLMSIVGSKLCRHLILLLCHDNSDLFFAALRGLFMLFESCRHYLKLQMEWFLNTVMTMLRADITKISLIKKEFLLECLLQLLGLTGFVAELYVNYDCSLYCSSLCEIITKQLSKMVTATVPGVVQSTSILALDCLVTVVSSVQQHCASTDDQDSITPSQLLSSRQMKKVITAGTEQFNKSPSVGLAFLQEQGILATPTDPAHLAAFFRHNPAINKHVLGDYLGSRNHGDVLDAFVKSFQFNGVKLVDALREFLESFRLPGEAPVISHIMEMFAAHWLSCNTDQQLFADADAVYVLCYAIMMLQTDLHSSNLRQRMTLAEFIEARRGMNNGKDYPDHLLADIYTSIKSDEIVLPSERSGQVKEDYEWKVMMARSSREDGQYLAVTTSDYHRDVFLLSWGPVAAGLSLALDTWPSHDHLLTKITDGFKLSACVAAQYQLREVCDHLVISLSRFTTLLLPPDPSTSVALSLAGELRARLSLQVMLSLCRQHGAMMREGWKNLLDCLLSLFRARLLPEEMVQANDFLSNGGHISLYASESQQARSDSSLLSSFFSYNYWLLSGETTPTGPSLTAAETNARTATVALLKECGVHLLFSESKFLPEESLLELVKALVYASRSPDTHHSLGTVFDEECAVLFMELLITVTLENRDRVGVFLSDVTHHISAVILSERVCRRLRERSVVGLMILAIRLLHKDSTVDTLFSALNQLSDQPIDKQLRRQLSKGLTELTHAQASNISSNDDWTILMGLIEYVATGLHTMTVRNAPSQFDLLNEDSLPVQDPGSFFTLCDSLCHLVRRDSSCVTTSNFTAIVHTVRLFSEVTSSRTALEHDRGKKKGDHTYAAAALKLLDLLDTLYSHTHTIFIADTELTEEKQPSVLWHTCWCPLLEGIARLCCDVRHGVRQMALAYLQRALLAYTLHTLTAYDWEACFLEVFFPMLSRLIEESNTTAVEESQMRACNLLCKLFLQHLPQLSSVDTFPDLWLGILDFMDKYMHIEKSELLSEGIPESLKNMLLVMVTQGILEPSTALSARDNRLWLVTYQRVEQFLPGFLVELFPQIAPSSPPVLPPVQQQPLPGTGSSPPQPGTGSSPSQQPGTSSSPPQPGTGSSPQQQPGTGSSPQHPGTGSSPPQPGTGSSPPQPGTGSSPQHPGTGSSLPQPGTGSSPPLPGTSSLPPQQPGTGSSPQQPGTGSSPQQPGTGSSPPQPGTGSSPQQPGTGSSSPQLANSYQPGSSSANQQPASSEHGRSPPPDQLADSSPCNSSPHQLSPELQDRLADKSPPQQQDVQQLAGQPVNGNGRTKSFPIVVIHPPLPTAHSPSSSPPLSSSPSLSSSPLKSSP